MWCLTFVAILSIRSFCLFFAISQLEWLKVSLNSHLCTIQKYTIWLHLSCLYLRCLSVKLHYFGCILCPRNCAALEEWESSKYAGKQLIRCRLSEPQRSFWEVWLSPFSSLGSVGLFTWMILLFCKTHLRISLIFVDFFCCLRGFWSDHVLMNWLPSMSLFLWLLKEGENWPCSADRLPSGSCSCFEHCWIRGQRRYSLSLLDTGFIYYRFISSLCLVLKSF